MPAYPGSLSIERGMFFPVVAFLWANADVLPPGQGRAVGVEVVEFMPVGSDVLLALSSLVSS